jgi:hypothetical protein
MDEVLEVSIVFLLEQAAKTKAFSVANISIERKNVSVVALGAAFST